MVTRSREYVGAAASCHHGILGSQIEGIAMRLRVDRDSDALYFRLDESAIVESEEV